MLASPGQLVWRMCLAQRHRPPLDPTVLLQRKDGVNTFGADRRDTCNSVPQVKEQGPIIFYTHNKFCPVKELNPCIWSWVSELADESPMLY
jgi:hypothetical protein